MIRLYPKNLTSIGALRKEIALKKAEADASYSNLWGADDAPSRKEHATESGIPDIVQLGMDFITSRGTGNKLWALALPALKLVGTKVEKDVLKSVAKEFLVGYAKWKAIEMGFNIARSAVEKRSRKKG